MQQKYKFLDVFIENPDSSLSPKVPISVNGVNFGSSVSFARGVSFGGIDFHQYKYLDIAGDLVNGVLVIKGFFKN